MDSCMTCQKDCKQGIIGCPEWVPVENLIMDKQLPTWAQDIILFIAFGALGSAIGLYVNLTGAFLGLLAVAVAEGRRNR